MSLPKWVSKLPKRVTICGRPYKITYNMLNGASFRTSTRNIVVGCRYTKDETADSLFHEISEIIHCELGFRSETSYSEVLFVMDHQKFQQHSMLLFAALKDCGLLK